MFYFCCQPFFYLTRLELSAVKTAVDTEEPIQDIVSEVINRTMDKAREVVYRNTGIDVVQEGYSRGRRHEALPRGASDETRRELLQLRREHDREIINLRRNSTKNSMRQRENSDEKPPKKTNATKLMKSAAIWKPR